MVVLGARTSPSAGKSVAWTAPAGINKIKHIIVVMQENRSFDSYFGTFPGANGIPMKNGKPRVCLPDPRGGCAKPHHNHLDVNYGGPHGVSSARADIHGGRMDGFVRQAVRAKS